MKYMRDTPIVGIRTQDISGASATRGLER